MWGGGDEVVGGNQLQRGIYLAQKFFFFTVFILSVRNYHLFTGNTEHFSSGFPSTRQQTFVLTGHSGDLSQV